MINLITVPHECTTKSIEGFVRLPQYANKYVTSGILWIFDIDSKHFCAIECNIDAQCVSFFYGNNICSGYDKNLPDAGNVQLLSGINFYQIRGLLEETTTKHEITTELVTTVLTTTELETTTVQPSTNIATTNTVPDSWCTGDRYVKDPVTSICYKAWDTQLSWADARNVCQGEGGDLAILDTDAKINLVSSIPDYKCAPGKLGPKVNKCYWTTPIPLAWSDTGTECGKDGGILGTFPDNITYYIVLNGTGIIESTDYWWIGLNDIATEAVFKTSDGKDMPWNNLVDIYGYFGDDCLTIAPLEDFKFAEEHCSLSAYRGVCESPLVCDFWIGGSDIATENIWQWTNGGGMDMGKWHSSQPGGNTLENCAVLRYDSNGNKFADEDCLQTRDFICEKTIP
ncbi:CLEC3A [Mytilus coruscus]|uniref:CLEC3A n=1 Tax=Mytilus coruscus TaxID=42192 RepID=A0A6J8BDK2_MYTCO|nr:CLEC3A [Mytilus coruscus]